MEIGNIIKIDEHYLSTNVIYIYGLYDPADNVIKYVGKSPQPVARLYQHFNSAFCKNISISQNGNTGRIVALEHWIISLIEQGRKPEMKILDITDNLNWNKVERNWINKLHDENGKLFNSDSQYQSSKLGKFSRENSNPKKVADPETAKIIKNFRRNKKLTQAQFGAMVGVDGSAVSLWEGCKRAVPVSVLIAIKSF